MASATEKALDNYERFSYARDNGHLDFVSKADLCDAYFRGDHWDPATRDRLNRLGKPVITINKVLSTCATVFGEQLANRSDVSFRPAKDGIAETASALDKVWLHIAMANDLDWVESEVAADGFIRGRGFFDVRLAFDDQLMGEVRITQLNSKSVVIDPDASTYDPTGWKEVFITKWLTLDDIAMVYGKSYAKEAERKGGLGYAAAYDSVDWLEDTFGTRNYSYRDNQDDKRRIYRIIERQHREMRTVDCLVDLETGDLREVPEAWDRERVQLVAQQYNMGIFRKSLERIRWTVSTDDILLHDKWSPYKQFSVVPYFPYFRHGRTLGIVENMISPQDLLNKSISQELHITNTTANSGWILKQNALTNMSMQELEERGGEDGLVITVNGNPSSDIVKISPNQVPSGIDRLSFKADEALKEVSMVSDSMRGFDREDVAAKAIEAKQSRGAAALAKPLESLAQTRKMLARNTLDIVQRFYTEERVLNITGRDLKAETEELRINQPTEEGRIINDLTLGEYSVVINTVPSRASFEQSQFQEAIGLRKIGIQIPDDVVIEASHLLRKKEIVDRMRSGEQQGPSEVDMQKQALEMQKVQAEIEERKSNAQLNTMRAQRESEPKPDVEMMKLALEREKLMVSSQLQRQQLDQDRSLRHRELDMKVPSNPFANPNI